MALEGKGTAGVVLGTQTLIYETSFSVILAVDGRFLFDYDDHVHYRNRNVEFGYDGENFLYLIRPGDEAGNQEGFAYLSLDTEHVPIFGIQDDVRDALWLTLGSGRLFRDPGLSGTEIPNPFLDPRHSIEAHGFTFDAKVVNERFPLTSEFLLVRDYAVDKATREEEERRFGLNRLHSSGDFQWNRRQEWKDGQRAVYFAWERDIEVADSVSAPLSLEVSVYDVRRPDVSVPLKRIHLRFDSWEIGELENKRFLPMIEGRIYVTDFRVRRRDSDFDIDFVNYYVGPESETGEWRRKDDPWLLERAAYQATTHTNIEGRIVSNRIVVIVIGLSALLLPLVIVKMTQKGNMSED